MKSTAYIYMSARYAEAVVVTNKFTSDGIMFYSSADAHAFAPEHPKALGKLIKSALKASRRIDKSEAQMRVEWEDTPFCPLEASSAHTMEEFDSAYYPLFAYVEDHAIWVRAVASAVLTNPPSRFVLNDSTEEELGREVYRLWSDISNVVAQ